MDILELTKRVRPEVLHCAPDLMEQAILDTIRDFCRFTRAYQYEVDMESIVALVSDYDIELPNTSTWPIAIERMAHDGADVIFKDQAWLTRNIPNWRKREADDFRFFTQMTAKTFTFPCVPQNGGPIGALSYLVSLMPTEDATVIDDELADEFAECWADGAKAKLKAMSDKPWANSQRAGELSKSYLAARGQARIRITRSRGNVEDQWVGPRFA